MILLRLPASVMGIPLPWPPVPSLVAIFASPRASLVHPQVKLAQANTGHLGYRDEGVRRASLAQWLGHTGV